MDMPMSDKIGRSLDKKVTKRYFQICTVFVTELSELFEKDKK